MPKLKRCDTRSAEWIPRFTGHFIQEQRKELDLSGSQLAAKMHLSQQQISRYERGMTDITLSTLIRYFEALNMPTRDIGYFFELFLSQYEDKKSDFINKL